MQVGTWGIIFLAASLSTLVVMGLKSLSVEVKTARKPTMMLVFVCFLSIAGNYLQKQEKVIIDESTIDESIVRGVFHAAKRNQPPALSVENCQSRIDDNF